jgi:MFS family permease
MLRPAAPGRARAVLALFAGAAAMNAAIATGSVVSTIAVADLLGTGWGGLPNTAAIVATGAGALLLSRLMAARGRRAGLLTGYAVAVAGAVVATAALAGTSAATPDGGTRAAVVLLVTGGMLLVGLGNAAAQLSRYAAAELFPPHRRGFAIGLVVWSGTVGAVGGPLLLAPAEGAAVSAGWAAPAGPFAFVTAAAVVAALAAATLPRRPPGSGPPPAGGDGQGPVRLRSALRTPAVRGAFAVMATAQVVMVLVMTAVPLAMHHHGHGIGLVGVVLSAHTLGMFVLSPVTGRLLDVAGDRPVTLAGLALLVLGAVPVAVTDSSHLTGVAVFGLGVGWNLCFVGGSAALSRDVPAADRTAVEGAVDAGVWGLAAVGSMAATSLLAVGGLGATALVAAALGALPAAVLVSGRRRPRARTP